MRAMILAAGYGTRLWPLTIDRAKPAIPFMGRPLVGYVAEYLARFGFGEIAVNLHHRGESVRAALETHRRTRALATLVLRENAERERYSTVSVRDGLITGFGGNPTSDNVSGAASAARNELPSAVNEFREGRGEEFAERRVESKVESRVVGEAVTKVSVGDVQTPL